MPRRSAPTRAAAAATVRERSARSAGESQEGSGISMGMSEERRRQPEAEREVRFGRFRLHPSRGLTRGPTEVRVTPKSLAVLHLLAGRPGEVVSKEDLFRFVW